MLVEVAGIFFGKRAVQMIRDLARRLSAFGEFVGNVIAELEFRRGSFTAAAKVVKIHSAMAVICVQTSQAQLLVKLIRPRSQVQAAVGCRIQSSEKIWRVFTASEVLDFVTEVGDKNEIHRLNPPIVPGLLILEALTNSAEFAECSSLKIRFKNFITAGEPLTLHGIENRFAISCAGVRKVLITATG